MFDACSVSLRTGVDYLPGQHVFENGLKILFVYFPSFVNFNTHSMSVDLIVVGKHNYAELVYCLCSTILKLCNQMLS
jgi:hypothetical protein